MAYAAGVDVGSTQTKAIIVDDGTAKSSVVRSPTPVPTSCVAAENAFARPRSRTPGVREEREVEYVVGTGYGRYQASPSATRQVTEISCHGRGAVAHVPRTPGPSLDMGGQDTKAISVHPSTARSTTSA